MRSKIADAIVAIALTAVAALFVEAFRPRPHALAPASRAAPHEQHAVEPFP